MEVHAQVASGAATSWEEAEKNIRFIQEQQFDISEVKGFKAESQYLVNTGSRQFYVGGIIYDVLDQIKKGGGLETIVQKVGMYLGKEKEAETARLVNDQVIGLFDEQRPKQKKPVKSLSHILNPANIKFIIDPLSRLYDKAFFFPVFVILAIGNIALLWAVNHGVFSAEPIPSLSAPQYLVYMAGILFLILVHEIGHSAAAARYGILPNKIGFGFYFLFPAFYTDLTAIWSLHPRDRIIINLGGIYVQLLLNIFLTGLLLVSAGNPTVFHFTEKFILFNVIISFYNINPFFRFDGYWVFSDLFGLPNLRSRSRSLMGRAIAWVRGKQVDRTDFTNLPLVIYSVLYVAFMSFIWYFILKIILVSHVKAYLFFPSLLKYYDILGWGDWKIVLPQYFVVTLFWSILGYRIYRIIKKRRQHV